VCLADETDGDTIGPSRCDPDQMRERDVCRGLTEVWASLWNMKAFEERAWYGIDHRQVAMGILVNTRTKGELANIVAFTGNPLRAGDDRYLVNAQVGELDVVSAKPGVWPEKVLLTVEGGAVVAIERARLDRAARGRVGARRCAAPRAGRRAGRVRRDLSHRRGGAARRQRPARHRVEAPRRRAAGHQATPTIPSIEMGARPVLAPRAPSGPALTTTWSPR
jgi:hypothetical protein